MVILTGKLMPMYRLLILAALLALPALSFGQAPKTVHVFVALCDNVNQGIVPVPASLGNGQEPHSNLYWGALYGVKTFFKRSQQWELVQSWKAPEDKILERLLFRHKTSGTFMLADAWDGAHIQPCMAQFVAASSGKESTTIEYDGKTLAFGGQSDCVAFTGHNGLMEFEVPYVDGVAGKPRAAMILACAAKSYVVDHFKRSKATPVLWTTGLMAPEAYTLAAALEGWIKGEPTAQVRERAAQAYNKYHKCGISGARRLFDCSR